MSSLPERNYRLALFGARSNNAGLGQQTYNFWKFMKPEATLVINLHDGKPNYPERYVGPGVEQIEGFPNDLQVKNWLDRHRPHAVFTVEIPYNYSLYSLCRARGITTFLQYNYEFLDYLQQPDLPLPDVLMAPTSWYLNEVTARFGDRCAVRYLPVPVDFDRLFRSHRITRRPLRFLHVCGYNLYEDRNGTRALVEAIPLVKGECRFVLQAQSSAPGVADCRVEMRHEDLTDYTDLYTRGDVFFYPRRYAGLSLPRDEAMAAGLPVLMPAWPPNVGLIHPSCLLDVSSARKISTRCAEFLCVDLTPSDLARKIDEVISWSDDKLEQIRQWQYSSVPRWSDYALVYQEFFERHLAFSPGGKSRPRSGEQLRYSMASMVSRPWAVERWARVLMGLELPWAETELVILVDGDASLGEAVRRELQKYPTRAHSVSVLVTGNPPLGERELQSRRRRIRENWQLLLQECQGEILMGLEDDTAPDPDAYIKLLKTKKEHGAVFVQASIVGRWDARIVPHWTVQCEKGKPQVISTGFPNGKEVVPIQGGGWYCFVADMELFKSSPMDDETTIPLAGDRQLQVMSLPVGPDVHHIYQMSQHGLCLGHWGVRCVHFRKDSDLRLDEGIGLERAVWKRYDRRWSYTIESFAALERREQDEEELIMNGQVKVEVMTPFSGPHGLVYAGTQFMADEYRARLWEAKKLVRILYETSHAPGPTHVTGGADLGHGLGPMPPPPMATPAPPSTPPTVGEARAMVAGDAATTSSITPEVSAVQTVDGHACTTCGKVFPSEKGLNLHVRRVH